MPISSQGKVIEELEQPLATSSNDLLLEPGSPLPTNAEGQFVLSWGEEKEELPSDSINTPLPTTLIESPISETGPDGLPPMDARRRLMPPAFPESKDQPSLENEMRCNLREAVLDLLVSCLN